MAFKSLTPNLIVEDMDESLTFYRDLLGFQVTMNNPPEPPFEWAGLQKDDVTLFLQTRESVAEDLPGWKEKPAGGNLSLFLLVEDIEGLYEHLRNKAPVAMEMRTTFYGMKEFAVQDPSGFAITFAEPTES